MTRQLWTRFIATGLILIGQGVFASEISQRSDTEVKIFLCDAQVSPAVLIENSDDEWQTTLTGAIPKKLGVNYKYLTFSSTTNSITQSLNYNRYNPRAPPHFFL